MGLLLSLFLAIPLSAPVARSQSGVTLRGNVTDDSGGGVQGALVHLYSAKRFVESKADYDGAFEFLNIDPGQYEVEVISPGLKRVIKNIEVSSKTPAPVSIRLHVGVVGHCGVRGLRQGERFFSPGVDVSYVNRVEKVDVRGLVRDDLGSALAGVTVQLEVGGPSQIAVSNSRGEFEFSSVEPGKYILASSQAGFWDILRYLWITQENAAKVIVTLPDKVRVPCFEGSGPS